MFFAFIILLVLVPSVVITLALWILMFAFGKIARKTVVVDYVKSTSGVVKLWVMSVVLSIALIVSVAIYREIQFRRAPLFSVYDNKMTVLHTGSSSAGTHVNYHISEDGVVKKSVDEQYSSMPFFVLRMKIGYTFESIGEGEVYLAFVAQNGGGIDYIDVYDVVVKPDKSLDVKLAERIQSYDYPEVMKKLSDEYGFSIEMLEEEYWYYLREYDSVTETSSADA